MNIRTRRRFRLLAPVAALLLGAAVGAVAADETLSAGKLALSQ